MEKISRGKRRYLHQPGRLEGNTQLGGKIHVIMDNLLISRIRRNHGLEHATLHVLARHFPQRPIAGHSDPGGFWILGDIPTEDMEAAVQEALLRLRNGETKLALHPNCGTNFVTAGTLAGIGAAVAMFGAGKRLRDKLERLPMAATLATLALVVAQPIGMRVQERLTTSSVPGDLQVAAIKPVNRRGIRVHRVITKG